jgi:hypothetical protein
MSSEVDETGRVKIVKSYNVKTAPFVTFQPI